MIEALYFKPPTVEAQENAVLHDRASYHRCMTKKLMSLILVAILALGAVSICPGAASAKSGGPSGTDAASNSPLSVSITCKLHGTDDYNWHLNKGKAVVVAKSCRTRVAFVVVRANQTGTFSYQVCIPYIGDGLGGCVARTVTGGTIGDVPIALTPSLATPILVFDTNYNKDGILGPDIGYFNVKTFSKV